MKCFPNPRWKPGDFFEEKPSFWKLLLKVVCGGVIWVIAAFLLGAVIASFVMGSYLVVEYFMQFKL